MPAGLSGGHLRRLYPYPIPSQPVGTQETFRQLCLKCTKNGKTPLKLWFESSEEMEILSRKSNSLRSLFQLMDTQKLRTIPPFHQA